MKGYSQRERVIEHINSVFKTQEEHLWSKCPDYSVFRNPDSKKWYAIIMDIPKSRLCAFENEIIDVLNIKCSPIMLGSFLSQKGFYPAYHMNKSTWLSVALDESVNDELIFYLLQLSYNSVSKKSGSQKN